MLDSELAFMLTLSHELSQRQIAAFPARTVKGAQSVIAQFRLSIDLLVINCSRPGACTFAKALAGSQPGVSVVAIVSERYACRRCADDVVARFCDPQDRASERIGYCADVIQSLLKEQRRHAERAGGNQ